MSVISVVSEGKRSEAVDISVISARLLSLSGALASPASCCSERQAEPVAAALPAGKWVHGSSHGNSVSAGSTLANASHPSSRTEGQVGGDDVCKRNGSCVNTGDLAMGRAVNDDVLDGSGDENDVSCPYPLRFVS